ncbi:hypothetical protein Plhal304r1_c019g0069841 [Plasmopara halstedii]
MAALCPIASIRPLSRSDVMIAAYNNERPSEILLDDRTIHTETCDHTLAQINIRFIPTLVNFKVQAKDFLAIFVEQHDFQAKKV